MTPGQRLRRLLTGLLGMAAVGAGYALWVNLTHLSIPCPFHAITGLQCPGCGVTRMCLALLRLDVSGAWKANPVLLLLLPLLGGCWAIVPWCMSAGAASPPPAGRPWCGAAWPWCFCSGAFGEISCKRLQQTPGRCLLQPFCEERPLTERYPKGYTILRKNKETQGEKNRIFCNRFV